MTHAHCIPHLWNYRWWHYFLNCYAIFPFWDWHIILRQSKCIINLLWITTYFKLGIILIFILYMVFGKRSHPKHNSWVKLFQNSNKTFSYAPLEKARAILRSVLFSSSSFLNFYRRLNSTKHDQFKRKIPKNQNILANYGRVFITLLANYLVFIMY